MKNGKNYVVPEVIEILLDRMDDIYERAAQLFYAMNDLAELCDGSTIVIDWQNRIQEHNPQGVESFIYQHNIKEDLTSVRQITRAMLDATDLFETEIKRTEKKCQEEED